MLYIYVIQNYENKNEKYPELMNIRLITNTKH